MADKFEYEIGGKKFFQRPLVLGQIELITPIILKLTTGMSPEAVGEIAKSTPTDGAAIPEEGLNAVFEIADYLTTKKKMAEALSIVLIEDGSELATRSMEDVQNHLRWNLGMDIAQKVIQDFFTCNDWKSLGDMLSLGEIAMPTVTPPATETTTESPATE